MYAFAIFTIRYMGCGSELSLTFFISQNPQELMFQNGTITAQRFLTVVDLECPEMLEKITRELWLRAWTRVSLFSLNA